MKSVFKPGFLAGLALALAAVAGSAQAAYGYQGGYYDSRSRDDGYRNSYSRAVRCESRNGRINYCRMETRGGVSLIAQSSQNACIRGRTWGVSQDSVWVSRGCRGRFAAAGYRTSNYGYDRDRYDNRYDNQYNNQYGYQYNNQYNGQYNNQHNSQYNDQYNSQYNNGYDNRYGSSSGQVLRCESRDGRYNLCMSHGDGGRVQLRRQLSDSSCRLNESWGTRNGGVWVDRGCRGEFVIY